MRFFEKNILKKLKESDPKSFEILFNTYHKKIFSFVNSLINDRSESENIVQDVFVSIWETRHKLNIEIPFNFLVYRIAKNKSLNYLRKKLNKQHYIRYLIRDQPLFQYSTDIQIDFKELEYYFNKYINELPERRKEIFLCSLNEGLSYKEIAQKLKLSENTVDSQIRNALKSIRDKIAKQFASYKDYLS